MALSEATWVNGGVLMLGFTCTNPFNICYNAIKKPANFASNSSETEIPIPIPCFMMIDIWSCVNHLELRKSKTTLLFHGPFLMC